MSSVRVRDGRLFFDFRVKGHRCREMTTLPDTPANRRKMVVVLNRIDAAISAGNFDYRAYFPNSTVASRLEEEAARQCVSASPIAAPRIELGPTFSDFASEWQRLKAVEWRESYRNVVANVLDVHLLPVLGAMPVGGIDRAKVMELRAGLAVPREVRGQLRRRAPATINRVMGVLRMIFDEAAVRYDLNNPCTSVKRLKLQKVDIEPFSLEQVYDLIEAVRPDFRDYFTVRFFTGMRSGEAHGLRWEHVDFDRREIRIRETFAKGKTDYTKTDGSQREISMSQPVYEALRRQEKATRPRGQYVFCSRSGEPFDNHNFVNRVWKPLLRNRGLKMRRPYQMRHTCATLWLAAGENPEWIARQLGHTSTRMLFSVYSRFVPNLTRRDGVAFDRLITGAGLGAIESGTPTSAADDSLSLAQEKR